MSESKVTFPSYLGPALPFTISTLTQPLLGAVDTAVLGRMENASFMGGVAIETVVSNTMYRLLGFLRVSTLGMSSQSLGTGKEEDRYFSYFRSAILALLIGLSFVLLQNPIRVLALSIYDSPAMVGMVKVNANLLIRTVCLLVVINTFVAKGSSFGTEILAANAVLFQVQYLMAYIFDGFANASSVFAGGLVCYGIIWPAAPERPRSGILLQPP